MSVIFLFVDGVGLGEEKRENPFYKDTYEAFKMMAGGQPFLKTSRQIQEKEHLFKGVDATLGVDGLPQSGTGQTALFTGVNSAKAIGKHFGPFPHSGIKHFLREESLFIKAEKIGLSCFFMNAYPEIFFQKSKRRNRWSCTTLMVKSAGLPLNGEKQLKEGKAVTAGIDQKVWKELLHIDVPEISPQEAAERTLQRANENELVLYEYYLTDKAGHSQNHEEAKKAIQIYNQFVLALIKEKKKEDTLILCSDHGNVEDLSLKTHTLNKVPLYAFGPGAEAFKNAESIMDVTPGILSVLREK